MYNVKSIDVENIYVQYAKGVDNVILDSLISCLLAFVCSAVTPACLTTLLYAVSTVQNAQMYKLFLYYAYTFKVLHLKTDIFMQKRVTARVSNHFSIFQSAICRIQKAAVLTEHSTI